MMIKTYLHVNPMQLYSGAAMINILAYGCSNILCNWSFIIFSQVTVNSVSGRRVQDVEVGLPIADNVNHIILHLGTNNVSTSDRPEAIKER